MPRTYRDSHMPLSLMTSRWRCLEIEKVNDVCALSLNVCMCASVCICVCVGGYPDRVCGSC